MHHKQVYVKFFLCLFLFFGVAILSGMLIHGARAKNEKPLSKNLETFREFSIEPSLLKGADAWNERQYRQLAGMFLWKKGVLSKDVLNDREHFFYSIFLPASIQDDYQRAFYMALADGIYFPVAKDFTGNGSVSYENSWGGERSFGGKRRHEGTDLMPSVKVRGYFPVVSVSDGIVEKKGWLKLGGYRLGIRAPHGAYYYYAHLDHYAGNIEEGKLVKAGEIIGYMGDTGYGEEGTKGQFDVHLHFGIYLTIDKKEVSINPYSILKSLEEKRIPFGQTEGEIEPLN